VIEEGFIYFMVKHGFPLSKLFLKTSVLEVSYLNVFISWDQDYMVISHFLIQTCDCNSIHLFCGVIQPFNLSDFFNFSFIFHQSEIEKVFIMWRWVRFMVMVISWKTNLFDWRSVHLFYFMVVQYFLFLRTF